MSQHQSPPPAADKWNPETVSAGLAGIAESEIKFWLVEKENMGGGLTPGPSTVPSTSHLTNKRTQDGLNGPK